MINIIRSILNRNKKLYIVINNTVSKGKIARVCATIGQTNPHMRFSKVIVVKTDSIFKEYKDQNNSYYSEAPGSFRYHKISGTHFDAGLTQCKKGTLLAFGVITHNEDNLPYKLY